MFNFIFWILQEKFRGFSHSNCLNMLIWESPADLNKRRSSCWFFRIFLRLKRIISIMWYLWLCMISRFPGQLVFDWLLFENFHLWYLECWRVGGSLCVCGGSCKTSFISVSAVHFDRFLIEIRNEKIYFWPNYLVLMWNFN